jgi:integrase
MTMLDQVNATPTPHKRLPWNKGKLTGAKPPLRPQHVWSIRTKLQIEGRTRDLAMFNLAIDSKLRGCDVVAIRVEDVAAGGYTAERAIVRQKKTGRPVRFELSEQTRQAIDDYLKAANKRPGQFLFTGRRGANSSMTTRQYARLVSKWIGSVGLDPKLFGTHSLRRTKATLIYRRTGNLRAEKHGQVPRHRGRRCLSDSGTSRCLKYPGQSGHALPDRIQQDWAKDRANFITQFQ